MRSVCFTLAICGLLALAATAKESATPVAKPVAKTESLGIVTEQPTEGPFVAIDGGYMVPYIAKLPGTEITFEMIPIPGGVVEVGEANEKADETISSRRKVQLEPFWIAKHEVTWGEYQHFMTMDKVFSKLEQLRTQIAIQKKSPEKANKTAAALKPYGELWNAVTNKAEFVDGVTAPTALYDPDVTYESGEDPKQPAVTMTQYAARQYTKWLSGMSGTQYRLPSEAEWEHAAGELPPPEAIDQQAWLEDNADGATHLVGKQEPNAHGLHDMLGNVAEWVLDSPAPFTAEKNGEPLSWNESIAWQTEVMPRIAKGGHWDLAAEDLTIAGRMLSEDEEWKGSDPNTPSSPWWYSDYPADCVGFRIVRPLQPMNAATQEKVWEIDSDDLRFDVEDRLNVYRRGKLGRADGELPAVVKQLDEKAVRALLE